MWKTADEVKPKHFQVERGSLQVKVKTLEVNPYES